VPLLQGGDRGRLDDGWVAKRRRRRERRALVVGGAGASRDGNLHRMTGPADLAPVSCGCESGFTHMVHPHLIWVTAGMGAGFNPHLQFLIGRPFIAYVL
jgi:hypothetical protein